MAKLIANYGGQPIAAPSMQEVPLESNTEGLDFARKLAAGGFDMVIFLTGVGTRSLARLAETLYPRELLVAALRQVSVVARGPKPVAALAELGVTSASSRPNRIPGARCCERWTKNRRGSRCAAGASPSRSMARQIRSCSRGSPSAALPSPGCRSTSGRCRRYRTASRRRRRHRARRGGRRAIHHIGADHSPAAHRQGLDSERAVLQSFARIVVGSIGPVTSEALREHGLAVDFEPEHPKMGFLVSEAARRGRELLGKKRAH